MSPLSLRQAAGQVLIVGLEGTQLSAVEAAWLRLLQPGGVILFRRNIENPVQTHALLRSVEGPRLRCIDVEGGTVDRLRDSIAPMPSAFAVATTEDASLFERHGALIGQEVSMLGLNATFAPVLDLRTPDSEPVMTSRVVGDSKLAARYAGFFLKGLKHQGVLGCGKHFPGLGSGQVDSHHATPVIAKPLNLLWSEDLLPYRELMKRLPMVMISHASYPAAVPEPASISGYWIREVLIKEMGYQGVIVSDDMEMGGILKYTGIAESAIAAIAAGTHIVEICRDPALIFTAYEALLREAESSPAFARLLRAAASKVQEIKTKPLPPAPTDTAVEKMRTAVERFREEVVKAGSA
jgi:beta-N-acetylhexosaminidase